MTALRIGKREIKYLLFQFISVLRRFWDQGIGKDMAGREDILRAFLCMNRNLGT
jgi:hypothetical protein